MFVHSLPYDSHDVRESYGNKCTNIYMFVHTIARKSIFNCPFLRFAGTKKTHDYDLAQSHQRQSGKESFRTNAACAACRRTKTHSSRNAKSRVYVAVTKQRIVEHTLAFHSIIIKPFWTTETLPETRQLFGCKNFICKDNTFILLK